MNNLQDWKARELDYFVKEVREMGDGFEDSFEELSVRRGLDCIKNNSRESNTKIS